MTAPVWMLLARIGLMACLYGFLAAVLILLWRDLRFSRGGLRADTPPSARLIWKEAPRESQGTFLLADAPNRIGRSPTVEVTIPDETISIVHARIWFAAGRWWLEDLGSKNGTWLNGLLLDQNMVLTTGDQIRLGRCVLEFQVEK